MNRKKILSALTVLLILLATVISVVYADTHYPIETATIDYVIPYLHTKPTLARWPSGVLHSVHNQLVDSAQEVFWDYSLDEGLNWTNIQVTDEGVHQRNPVLAISSNLDVHFAWVGLGGTYPTVYSLYYILYDESETSFGSIVEVDSISTVTAGQGILNAEILVDGNDTLRLVYSWYDPGSSSGKLYFTSSDYNGDGTWDSWDTPTEIGSASNDRYSYFDAAVDKDYNVGVAQASGAAANFRLWTHSTQTWGSWETLTGTSDDSYPALMARISAGNTVWNLSYKDTSENEIHYSERVSGSWGAEQDPGIQYESFSTCALEHSITDTNTGNYYLITGDASAWRYKKYTLGVGWGAAVSSTSENVFFPFGTKTLFPYTAEADWHWNMPLTGFAMTYRDDNDNGWYLMGTGGDEKTWYYLSGTGWGVFPPVVYTYSPTLVTKSTATFNGELIADGGGTVLSRGFEYGLSQTPTWSVSQSGSYGEGAYSLPVTGLEALTNYYVRAFVTTTEGTGHGDWIGFSTIELDAYPHNFIAIPVSSSQIDLSWEWLPAPDPDVRLEIYYQEGSYPASRGEGTFLYAGGGNGTSATGLKSGTSYFFRGWPYDVESETYSATYVEDWATTFGGQEGVDDPDIPDEWFQEPLCDAYENIPLLWDAVQSPYLAFGMPLVTCCVLFTGLWISVLAIGVGVGLLRSGLWTSTIASVLIFGCSLATLLPMWMIAFSVVLGGFTIYVWRRS